MDRQGLRSCQTEFSSALPYLMVSRGALMMILFFFSAPLLWAQNENDPEDNPGFRAIFDGNTLNGWSGDKKLWRVEEGAIVGETTPENPIPSNQFLIWDQGEVDDFILKLQFRISGSDRANSGVQIRSQITADHGLHGYQSDIDRTAQWLGIFYSEGTGRGILCEQGKRTILRENDEKTANSLDDFAELSKYFKADDWNEYEIQAVGNRLTNRVNGHLIADLTDENSSAARSKGALGLQLHAGPPMKIEFKDIVLKRLPLANEVKKIVLVAGTPSHGPGDHEHNAGCLLLAKCLDQAAARDGLKTLTTVYQNGWPADPTAFDNADVVVSFCDGGQGHYLNRNRAAFEPVMERGVGLVLIHYAVEVPAGPTGEKFLQWAGGYFEPHWSVNPFWTANFKQLPDHPTTRGLKPFELNDEWYYHMRFAPEMKGVTPILTALPPEESLSRPDGPHSGNPHVRKAVLENQEPQHVAWAFERPDGKGRGFGFTGAHFHRNWQHDDFRTLILNAIVWTAKLEVPENGVPSTTPTEEEIVANQDPKSP
jgi:type 1 glutamine amidotransferase